MTYDSAFVFSGWASPAVGSFDIACPLWQQRSSLYPTEFMCKCSGVRTRALDSVLYSPAV